VGRLIVIDNVTLVGEGLFHASYRSLPARGRRGLSIDFLRQGAAHRRPPSKYRLNRTAA
jgi:hypothetical protein